MPSMPENISKGRILKLLDGYINTAGDPKAKAQEAKALLAAADANIVDVLKDRFPLATQISPTEEDHLREDWFNRKGTGWWQKHQPIAPVIRQGFIEACDYIESNSTKKLDVYWACAGDHVEVWLLKGEVQLTMIIATPPPEMAGVGPVPEQEILVVKPVMGSGTLKGGNLKQQNRVAVVEPKGT